MIYGVTFCPELIVETESKNVVSGGRNDVFLKGMTVSGGCLTVSEYYATAKYRDVVFVGDYIKKFAENCLREKDCIFLPCSNDVDFSFVVKSNKRTSFKCMNDNTFSFDVFELVKVMDGMSKDDVMVLNEDIGNLTNPDFASELFTEAYRRKIGLILRCDSVAIKAALKYGPNCLFVDKNVLSDYFGKTPLKENDFIECAINLQKFGASSVIVQISNKVIVGLDDFGGIYRAELNVKREIKDVLSALIGGFMSALEEKERFYNAFCYAVHSVCSDSSVIKIETLRTPVKKEVIRNISHYLKENKNISLSEKELNILDLAVFSQLPMLDIGTVEKETVGMDKACKIFSDKIPDGRVSLGLIVPQTYPLLALCSQGKRFGSAVITRRKSVIDKERVVQFIAMTIRLSNGDYVVSFSGTDDTIVGWKEDFYLLYDSPTQSQLCSVDYLNETFSEIEENAKVYIVGHSKGGNLAIYGAVGVDSKYRDRIAKVINFDGPGFTEKFYKREGFETIKEKIVAVIPQLSVVGRLFIHEENVMIVKSCFAGIYQHDLLSWETSGENFTLVPKLDELSDKVQNKVNEVTVKLTPLQRKIFVEGLFSMLYSTDSFTLTELLRNRGKLFGSFFKCDSKTRNLLFKVTVELGADRYVREMLMVSLRESEKMRRKKDFEEITIIKGDIDSAIESIGVIDENERK